MGGKLDIEAMDLSALRELRNKIDIAIEARLDIEREAMARQVREMAARVGLSVRQLVKIGSTPHECHKNQKPRPKYQHPKNATITWSGRGGVPGWVRDWEGGGNKREELLISRAR
ncbi:MAG: H-NS histone family protein [Kaiparowitsia implicata GSE-PSE-MK54-09C]|nr:H-NS histone family protein [Kaiparowitsia implicata GSE-PSE-MK54-09C]